MSQSRFHLRAAGGLALAGALVALTARADVVIFKDGYTIHGLKTVKEKSPLEDADSGMVFIVDKPNGMVALDDGARWVVFPSSPLQVADVGKANRFQEFTAYTRLRERGDQKLPSTVVNGRVLKNWDPKEWKREIRFDDADGRAYHTVRQHINVLTPHYLRVGSSSHVLTQYYLTKEHKPEFIRSLLVNHPDLVEKPGEPDPERREKLVRFWIQADWLDEADKDLSRLIADLPAEKARYTRLKAEVNGLRAGQLMAEIERARDAGRHQFAIKALETFPKDDVPPAISDKVTKLRAEYETRTARYALARRYLDELPRQVNAAANQFLVEAAQAVRAEVHMDTLARLDMFVTLAERAEKDAKAGRRPAQSPEELIASAVTGWHLGKVAAEAKVGPAYKVWVTRLMALDYLRTASLGNRQRVLKSYLEGPNALAYDELEKLVSLLPPPDAPETLPKGVAREKLLPTVAYPNGVDFLLKLPDEYQPGRSYPVVIGLPDPDIDRGPAAFLERFGDLPSRHGYILAVPEWWGKTQSKYTYTKEEHGVVLQLLRHLRRAYQVDSDRVFMWGNGEGGSMALDVGGSHPDLFAGILPVNPTVTPKLYITCEYWVNFFQLPVYMVMGDKFGLSVNSIKLMSERWMPRGYPALVVSYKGRGQDWFGEELPYAFDWMSRKRRADPGKVVGPPAYEGRTMAAGFSSVRLTDNRFHWLSSDEINPASTMTPILGSEAVRPAKFSARIAEGNAVQVKAFGVRAVTVWFGRGMVDYAKPVKVTVNGVQTKPLNNKVAPEVPVLMEDLYERGDRQRPYFARLDFKVGG